MIFNGANGGGTTVRGPIPADADFTPSSYARDVVVVAGISPTTITDKDTVLIATTGATLDHEADLSVREEVFDTLPATFESLDPSIASVDADGKVIRVGDGIARILVKARLVQKRVDVAISRETPAPARVFQYFLTGSLAKECSDAIDTRLAGKSASTTKLIHNGTAYSSSRWCADIDLTCVSREIPRCTLVAPDVVIMAQHYQNAGPISFLKEDGTVVTRTITTRLNVGPAGIGSIYSFDMAVGRLASAVDAGITFAKVLPATWESKFGFVSASPLLPILYLDQEEKALVGDVSIAPVWRLRMSVPSNVFRRAFYEDRIGGDSGNPAFLIINGSPVLVTAWSFGGAGAGLEYSEYLTAINAAMTTVGSIYQLTTQDLSSYPTY